MCECGICLCVCGGVCSACGVFVCKYPIAVMQWICKLECKCQSTAGHVTESNAKSIEELCCLNKISQIDCQREEREERGERGGRRRQRRKNVPIE